MVPVIARMNAASPAVALEGEMLVAVGRGLLTVRLLALEVPPPGSGLKTVMNRVPAVAMSAAVICAVNWVALTNVVTRSAPSKRTIEPLLKFVPSTVSVNAAPPIVCVAGVMVVMVGTGLLTVKSIAAEVPPPGAGLNTVMAFGPADEISAAVICARS